jgi:4-hydroxymandelate oxidase
MTRREAFRKLAAFAAASPLCAQKTEEEDVNAPVNIHEFEAVAKRKLDPLAYDFIAGGVEDERTVRANLEAYDRVFLVPRVMVDVSTVDTSIELLGIQLSQPILIAPTGGKELIMPNAEVTVAKAARASHALMCSATGVDRPLLNAPDFHWWTNTIGQATKPAAMAYARRVQDVGSKGIVVTVDNQYQSDRDRNNRNRFDYDYMRTGIPKPGERGKPRSPALAAMWEPHTPNMTWEYIDWLRGACRLPVILKGILSPDDARIAVERGAAAVIVSNHGGRQLDGAIATLDALPGVVDAVGGRIPVLMDGGIRRGSDILKALALGAKAILVGRAPLWGLAAFGQAGIERVLWMLGAELKLDMALAGKPTLAAIDRTLVRHT